MDPEAEAGTHQELLSEWEREIEFVECLFSVRVFVE